MVWPQKQRKAAGYRPGRKFKDIHDVVHCLSVGCWIYPNSRAEAVAVNPSFVSNWSLSKLKVVAAYGRVAVPIHTTTERLDDVALAMAYGLSSVKEERADEARANAQIFSDPDAISKDGMKTWPTVNWSGPPPGPGKIHVSIDPGSPSYDDLLAEFIAATLPEHLAQGATGTNPTAVLMDEIGGMFETSDRVADQVIGRLLRANAELQALALDRSYEVLRAQVKAADVEKKAALADALLAVIQRGNDGRDIFDMLQAADTFIIAAPASVSSRNALLDRLRWFSMRIRTLVTAMPEMKETSHGS